MNGLSREKFIGQKSEADCNAAAGTEVHWPRFAGCDAKLPASNQYMFRGWGGADMFCMGMMGARSPMRQSSSSDFKEI
jgi:hypothetical protein